MAEQNANTPSASVMEIYDTNPDGGLICRVCGSLVAGFGEYPQAHWDWHEAPNGA